MNLDLQTVNDPVALKAMAYDAIAAKEQAEQNLRAINQRIREVLGHVPPAGETAADGGSVDETTAAPADGDGTSEPEPAQ